MRLKKLHAVSHRGTPPLPSAKHFTPASASPYPRLSPARKAAFLEDFKAGMQAGAVSPPAPDQTPINQDSSGTPEN